jgi:hypothetical protein
MNIGKGRDDREDEDWEWNEEIDWEGGRNRSEEEGRGEEYSIR